METATLLLRPLEPGDTQMVFEQMLSDPDTVQDIDIVRHTDASMTHEYITEALVGWKVGAVYRYALVGKENGTLTALIELTPRLPQITIGVVISRKGGYRRRRTGIAALRELLRRVLEQPGVYRICAYCAVDGLAYSSMERLGFKREALLVNYEARPNRGLLAADSYLYAMTRPAPNLAFE
ncbi:GNAT family N-acetyltransferase [Paraburkholderia humisilvae]|nr:GNAT family N-acetyltransferase [Paraburkholderia humisilvae]